MPEEFKAIPRRARDLTCNGAERFIVAVLILETFRENLNHHHLSLEFPPQYAPRSGKPLVPARFAPALKGWLQDLLRRADQMRRRFDPQVYVLSQR